ncbi:3'-5' exonuclease [Moorena sp. SIO4G3]|uniref:3'-5' exonuclease n=1 Tax=Moorena sp. SIO4G3 TaxID=2607821 RepID=UPI0014298B08|nr:3'-5' exonuclease [Moorena sp. SIO4G3]
MAVINHQAETVLNTLVKPSISIPAEFSAIHGITDEMVVNAPTLPEIWQDIEQAIDNKNLLIYNADFDLSILNYCRKLYKLSKLKSETQAYCLMEIYAQYCGEWSDYYKSYKWQPLCGGHRALDDCLAVYELIEEMAADDFQVEIPYPQYLSE